MLGKQKLNIGKRQWQYKVKIKTVTKVIPRWNTVNYEISPVQIVIANPFQFKTVYCSVHGMVPFFCSSIAIQGLCGPVVTDICVFIAVVGQVTARV